nr:DNA translocase FtsK [Peteryoungia ipomoeae]
MRSAIATTQSARVGGTQTTGSAITPASVSQSTAMPTVSQPPATPITHVPQVNAQTAHQPMQQSAQGVSDQTGVVRPAHARNVFFRPAAPATQPIASGQPSAMLSMGKASPPSEAVSPAYGPHMTVGRPAGAVLASTRGQAPATDLATAPAMAADRPASQPETAAIEAQSRLPISALLSDHIFFEAMFEPAEPAASVAVHSTPVAMIAEPAVEPMQQQTLPPRIANRTVRSIEVALPTTPISVTAKPGIRVAWPAFDAPVGSVVALYREVARREVSGIALAVGMTTLPIEQVVAAQVAAHSIIPVSHPVTSARQPLFRAQQALGEGEYELPPIKLLQQPPVRTTTTMTAEALEQSAGLLESVLEDFGVKGEVIDVRPGPVVTLYEFEPAPGVKSSRVIGISDDIARSMSALSARVAVVPGRNVIGIELPNPVRETVYLRELIETPEYSESRYKLPVCLGKTIGGESVIAELAKMPHLLVAGTTGSGKSVAINTMILSLLYRFRPDECRLIMVDPKMLELSVYDGIPHLLTPVVTDPKKAVMALKWAVREMEDRYRKMSRLSVRNIDGYNARAAQAREKGETITVSVQTGFDRQSGEIVYEEQELDLSPMPYIVVVVDEMADLMMVAGKEIEGAIQRLAQMARAAGIHLIMATQRPSVDVITGTIKANFPTRVSFQVTSKIDSRTILGEPGAEHLLGQGDMLHMVGGGRIARVHGPFVSDEEVEKVVAHLKLQGRPEYLGTVTEDADEAEEEPEEDTAVFDKGAMAEEDGNDLFDKAVKVVLRDKKCSTSYIQRRLSIGYNKAASLVERMEQEGIVGPANHVGKRSIIVGGREASPVAEDFDN